MIKNFPHFKQLDTMDCGPTCLQMIAKYYGRNYYLTTLRKKCNISHEGVSLLGISEAAESIGFRSMGVRVTYDQLVEEQAVPFIAHWSQEHFVVVYKITKDKAWVSDPVHGKITYTKDDFIKQWASTEIGGEKFGICLLLETTPDLFNIDDEKPDKTGFLFLFKYLKPHKKFIIQLALGLLIGSLIQLVFPFLTQAVVDVGINTRNIGFIYLILAAQGMLFLSQISVEFIRSWIMLHVSTRINISLISDFLVKLMKLPIRFFDTKMTGDIIQRIEDHSRIESFLTGKMLSVLFSMVNLLLFGIVLIYYNSTIFLVFLTGSVLYFSWVYLFMKKRRDIDYKRFAQMSAEQSKLYQMINGMQEIKLNNCEKQKRWEWERIQASLFRVNVQSLSLSQYQRLGGFFFNQTKNIIITIMTAMLVVQGKMTLGMMLSVQYILGQLNSPIEQMITFIHSAQDAKISLERLGEIHNKEDEVNLDAEPLSDLPIKKDLNINKLTFQYEGPRSPKVINDITLKIPEKKITAIVGTSGSGKTTLIKMLLGFYEPIEGEIKVGETNLRNFNQGWWRSKCGVVMQDGYVFSDSIANNIAVSDEIIDKEKLLYAVKIANIQEYIENLPLGYNTKIGQEGVGLSQGQKQRILIARAVYKDPEYIFLDEATNALDANNEKVIMENLNQFFRGRTVIIVAHRLSTVRNADQILVIEKGKISETGTHPELVDKSGAYFNLVKNQLELGG